MTIRTDRIHIKSKPKCPFHQISWWNNSKVIEVFVFVVIKYRHLICLFFQKFEIQNSIFLLFPKQNSQRIRIQTDCINQSNDCRRLFQCAFYHRNEINKLNEIVCKCQWNEIWWIWWTGVRCCCWSISVRILKLNWNRKQNKRLNLDQNRMWSQCVCI